MTEHEDLVARLTDELLPAVGDALYLNAYVLIRSYATSDVAFTLIERLDRIRAVIEAVEVVRAERG